MQEVSISANSEKVNFFQSVFLVLFLFGFELISFLPDLLHQESRGISIVYRAVFLMVTLIVIFRNRTYKIKDHYYIIFFWFLYLIRMFYDSTMHSQTLVINPLDLWTFSILLCILPTIATSAFYNKETLLQAKKWTFIVLIIINVLGLLNNSLFLKENEYLERADANTVLNTISFGKTSAVLIFMALLRINTSSFKKNIFNISVIVLALINLMIAGSRGPVSQLIIALLCYYIINRKKIKVSYILVLVMGFFLFVTFFPQYNIIYEVLFERFSNTGFDKNDSDIIRYMLLESGWNQFLEHPFFGDSLETTYMGTYPHNLIVEALMATGILGGILLIIIFIKAFVAAFKLQNNTCLDWLGAILIMQITSSFISGSIIFSVVLWPLVSIVFNYTKKFKTFRDENCNAV